MNDGSGTEGSTERRVPGRRGLATRERLLEVTREELDRQPFRELRVVDIARRAGVSPATFYQYFPDVTAAILELAEQLADRGGDALHDLVAAADWSPTGTPDAARELADGFLRLWAQHRSLLAVIDLLAGEGDHRFRASRTRLLGGPTKALADIETPGGERMGRAEVGVLVGLLAHAAAHSPGLVEWGADEPEVLEAMARHVAWAASAGRGR